MSGSTAVMVKKWDVFEVVCQGRTEGNPFTDYTIQGVFKGNQETVHVSGFYDGDGIYKVRFMPSFEGEYSFEVQGTCLEETITGSFYVTAPAENNHGPVRTANTYHFAYEDGTPYYSIGTTCYVWDLQSDERIEETLESLKEARFNKIRFCVFPKHYDYNLGEPRSYPYEGTPMDSSVLTSDNFNDYTDKTEGNHWDFMRFNPAHFRQVEKCIEAVGELGIEADLIVMHPYDRWGFSRMTKEQDALYWNYVIARFGHITISGGPWPMSMICFHISLRKTGKAMRILSVKVTPTIICVPSTTAMDSMTTAVPGLPIAVFSARI